MKNALLKSFLVALIFLNAIFFYDIVSIFYIISDALWSFTNFDVMCVVLGCIYFVLFVVFLVYFFKHRDRNEIVKTVEFASPNDMNPAEVGFLVDGIVDGSDLSALLVYWAGKKYIEISNDKKKQKIKKIAEKLPEDSKSYEKRLYTKIFGNSKEVLVDHISSRLSNDQTTPTIVREIEKSVGEKYFDKKTIWLRQLFICLFAALFYVTTMYFRLEYYLDIIPIVEIFAIAATGLFVIFADWLLKYYDYRHKNNTSKGRAVSVICFFVLMAAICGLCMYFFWTDFYQVIFLVCATVMLLIVVLLSRQMQIYKAEGREKLGKILGFRDFISVAEEDRIKMLVEENPDVFYEVLPYAFVLGVSDKWIKNLDVIKAKYPNMVDEKMVTNVVVYRTLFVGTHFSFVRTIHVANAARIAGGAISLGANGGRGGSKGGSNFGGIRRR